MSNEQPEYDLRVERITRFKNNKLFDEVAKVGTLAEFCRLYDLPYHTLNQYINLSKSPYSTRTLKLIPSAQEVVDHLNIPPGVLFPPELYAHANILRQRTAVLIANSIDMLPLLAAERRPAPELLESGVMAQELKNTIQAALMELLTPREQKVLEMRFGLNGRDEASLQEVGMEMGVGKVRIQQIEAKALRKLRKGANGRGYRLAACAGLRSLI